MNVYKVEIVQTETFVVDVLSEDETEAMEKAHIKWNDEIVRTGTEHYHKVGDTIMEFGTVYDVTGTDDAVSQES
jgi:hypothetical protein